MRLLRLPSLMLLLSIAAWAGPDLDQARALLAQQKFAEALAAARKAVIAEPGSAQAQVTLARAAEASGDVRLAGQSYALALELEPKNLEVSLPVADFLARNGEISLACEVYELAIASAPDNPVPLSRMARSLGSQYSMGRTSVTIEQVMAAAGRAANHPKATVEDAYCLADSALLPPYDRDRALRCREVLSQALHRWPDNPMLLYAQARMNVRIFKFDQARADFEKALRLGLPPVETQIANEQLEILKRGLSR